MIRINQLKIPYEKSKDEQGILISKIVIAKLKKNVKY